MTSPNTDIVYYHYITACRHRYFMYCITMCTQWVSSLIFITTFRRVWRYRRRTENTMAKRKSTKDIKRSTKYTHKTKNRVIRTPIKTMGEHSCSRRVSSSRSTSDTCRVHLVTNLVISHEWGKDREVLILWHRYSIAVN